MRHVEDRTWRIFAEIFGLQEKRSNGMMECERW